MTWVVVPNLNEARDQLDARFPNRDKASDGSVGNQAHAVTTSSHNPDKTGRPEYRDGDNADEVRARDFDADLRDPGGATMETVVQLWVKLARAGALWWVRYIIFNGRIWHRRDGFATRTYTGANKHGKHAHVNSDFTQAADTVTGTNWQLGTLGAKPAPAPKPKPTTRPAPGPAQRFPLPDGWYFGPKDGPARSVSGYHGRVFRGRTDRAWLQEWTRQLARRGWAVGKGLTWLRKAGNDGLYGPEYEALIKAFQRDQKLTPDGLLGERTWDAAYRNPIR